MLFAGCAGPSGTDAGADEADDGATGVGATGNLSDEDAAADAPRENKTFSVSHADFELPPRFGFFVNVTAVADTTCRFSVEGTGSFGNESVNLASVWVHRDSRGEIPRVAALTVGRGIGVQAFGVSIDEPFSNHPSGYTAGSSAAPTLSANESAQWLLVATALDDPAASLKFRFECEGDFDIGEARWTKSFDALTPGSFSGGAGLIVTTQYVTATKSVNETAARHVTGPTGSIHAVFAQHEKGPLTSYDGDLVARTPDQTAAWRIDEPADTTFGWIRDITGGPGDYSIALDYEAVEGPIGYVVIADWNAFV